MRGTGQTLPAGEWLFQDNDAFSVALFAEAGTVTISPSKTTDKLADFLPSSALNILLVRSGAIGDLLLLTPAIIALQVKFPNAKIHLCCWPRHFPIVQGLIGKDGLVAYPLSFQEWRRIDEDGFGVVIPLENVVEISTTKGQHATDAYAEALGVTVTDYTPHWEVSEDEKALVQKDWLHGDKSRVALHLRASSAIRDYPMAQWGIVIAGLLQRGWEVILFGNDGQVPPNKKWPAQLRECSHLSFREAAAVLSTCDAFCGVDSSFMNLCPALDIPALGLFGPVDWRTRIKDGNGQRALAGLGVCAPCGWMNTRAGQPFPPNGPCAKTGFCVPLAEIAPARIIAKIDALRVKT